MHHLLLLVVLFGWILFLYLSWQVALPVYVVAVVISLAVYWKITEARRKTPVIGKRAMIGGKALVARIKGDDIDVEYEGEIWRAVSPEPLHQGQRVIIKGVEGLVLKVVPFRPGG